MPLAHERTRFNDVGCGKGSAMALPEGRLRQLRRREYEIKYVSIFGRIDNLTNEHYAEVFGFPALGRAAYAGVKVRF